MRTLATSWDATLLEYQVLVGQLRVYRCSPSLTRCSRSIEPCCSDYSDSLRSTASSSRLVGFKSLVAIVSRNPCNVHRRRFVFTHCIAGVSVGSPPPACRTQCAAWTRPRSPPAGSGRRVIENSVRTDIRGRLLCEYSHSAAVWARQVRGFNVGGLLILNDPPAGLPSSSTRFSPSASSSPAVRQGRRNKCSPRPIWRYEVLGAWRDKQSSSAATRTKVLCAA